MLKNSFLVKSKFGTPPMGILRPAKALSLVLCLSGGIVACSDNNTQANKQNASQAANEAAPAASMASAANIEESWARATFALAKAGAAYFTITNTSDELITLVGASVDESIAAMTQFHHTVMQGGMMRMQELDGGIEIEAGARIELSPGGKHVMIMGLNKAFNEGESFDITLYFQDGSQLVQEFSILDKRG